jgi:hypothetical protein
MTATLLHTAPCRAELERAPPAVTTHKRTGRPPKRQGLAAAAQDLTAEEEPRRARQPEAAVKTRPAAARRYRGPYEVVQRSSITIEDSG